MQTIDVLISYGKFRISYTDNKLLLHTKRYLDDDKLVDIFSEIIDFYLPWVEDFENTKQTDQGYVTDLIRK